MKELKLRNGQWTIGHLFCEKEEDHRKSVNIAWTVILPKTWCVLEQFKDNQEVILLIQSCKTMYCYDKTYEKDFTEYIYHTGKMREMHSMTRCVDPKRKKSPKGQTICVLHYSEPDGRRSKYGGKSAKDHSILVQFKARSGKREDCNFLKHDLTQSFSTTHCLREDEWRPKPQGIPISQGTSDHAETEFAKWITGSSWSRSKKILKPPERIGKTLRETCCGSIDDRILGIPLSVVQQQDTNRNVQKIIHKFDNHSNKESFLHDLKKTEEFNKFSENSRKLIVDMNNTPTFPSL